MSLNCIRKSCILWALRGEIGGRYKAASLRHASHTAQSVGPGRRLGPLVRGDQGDAPINYLQMLAVDDPDFTPEYRVFLQEWAEALNVSVEVLLTRIAVATIDGYLYIENIPDYQPGQNDF